VRLVRETGKPIAQVARELGVNEGTLGNWVNADRRRRDAGDGQLSRDERAELVRLRRENAELAIVRHPAGEGPVAGAGPGRAGFPGRGGQPEVVRGRYRDRHRRGQPVFGERAGRALAATRHPR